MRGIHAYESRFIDAENLFEDETSLPCLFWRRPGADEPLIEILDNQLDESSNIFLYRGLSHHDAKTKRILETSILSDEHIANLKANIKSSCDLGGQIYAVSTVYGYGDYTNIYNQIEYTTKEQNSTEPSSEVSCYCLAADGKEPLNLQDIFTPGCDSTAIMEEAAVKNFKRNFGDRCSDDTYRAIFREVLANLDGFSIQGDSIYLYCSDFVNILQRKSITVQLWNYGSFLQEPLFSFAHSPFEHFLQYYPVHLNLAYKDIGAENLTIFD